MTRMTRMTRMSTAAVAVSLVLGALVATSCTDDGGSSASTTSTTADAVDQIPSSDGDGCKDATGDIGDVAGTSVQQGSLTEPAGIDLVSASATVNGPNLDVVYTTAGPIDEVPNVEFYLAQGEPLKPVSFEARVAREALGAWTFTYITWDTGSEVRTQLAVTPTVDGDTLSYSLPLDQLKPIANYLAFGVSAEVADGADKDDAPDVVFDDCSSLVSSSDSTATAGG